MLLLFSAIRHSTRAGASGAWLALALAAPLADAAPVATDPIGLGSDGEPIGALRVAAGRDDARLVVVVGGIGGIGGADGSGRAIREAVEAYADRADADRAFALVAVPVANGAGAPLAWPPTGAAYRENAEAHVLWRWLGLTAPDLVLLVGDDAAGLGAALAANDVAGVAPLAVRPALSDAALLESVPADLPKSAARVEIERRGARTPLELANLLAPIYGQSFDLPIYTDGMAIIARLGLGHLEQVERIVEPYVDGTRDSLSGPFGSSSLAQAGHLVFAELADRTGDPRYLERARAAADLGFDDAGRMLEAMPAHGEMSDSIFMGASILAAVGDLTGETRYFDMAARHIAFMNAYVRRDDGLYRHSPLTDAAWGRGNGFAALGYTLTLSKLPEAHPAYARLMDEYRALMATLARWQNADGTFAQVVDEAAAWHETSSTAIIGFSMQRGLNRGWLAADEFAGPVARAFTAVSARTDDDGGFVNVSESTNKQPSLDAYLMREALVGRDPRMGSFAMLFAVERAGANGP